MIWIILAILLGPSVLLLTLGRFRAVREFARRRLDLQQPPWWIREVMGIKFSLTKAILWTWVYVPGLAWLWVWQVIQSKFCRHEFDRSYGWNVHGKPDRYCSKCFRWRDHNGFVQ